MYDIAYHFDADPFRLTPDHRFCFRHKSYAKSKAYLDYALTRGEGFVMITGSPGSGKTTLLNDVLTNADKTNRAMARIVTTQLDDKDLLRMVAFAFKLNTQNLDKASILHHLEEFLVKQYQLHRHSLLIIDEAQDLDKTALEEIRLLTNLQIDGNSLLQVFLVGQNKLLDMIQDPTMEQLHQRLIASSHLDPMKAKETETYVIHRLRTAGWKQDPLISRGALRRIHIFSRGVPRIVNQLCSRFLLYGSVENKHKLDSHDVQEVITELCNEHLAPMTDNISAGILFNDCALAEEENFLEQYDQEFLDSTAFSDKQIPNEPQEQHLKTSNVHHISNFIPAASERRDVMRMAESKKETNPNNQVSSISYESTRVNSQEIDNSNRVPSSSSKEDDKRVFQETKTRHVANRTPNRQPYAFAGFLVALLFGIFILAFPEPAGKQAAVLNNVLISEKDSNHQLNKLKQNKALDLASIQNKIRDS
ncbi:MAG: AAA family ATPase, partial [Gammaproteobacteria bacterium]|nr:AAA family ATPase [Gammaproteobacteria bacterium]